MGLLDNLKIKKVLADYKKQAYSVVMNTDSFYERNDGLINLKNELRGKLRELVPNGYYSFLGDFDKYVRDVESEKDKIDREERTKARDYLNKINQVYRDRKLDSEQKLEVINKINRLANKDLKSLNARTDFMIKYEQTRSALERDISVESLENTNRAIESSLDALSNSPGQRAMNRMAAETFNGLMDEFSRSQSKKICDDYIKNNKYAQTINDLNFFKTFGLYSGSENRVLAQFNYNKIKGTNLENVMYQPYLKKLDSLGVSQSVINETYRIPYDKNNKKNMYDGVILLKGMGIVDDETVFFDGTGLDYREYLNYSKKPSTEVLNAVNSFSSTLPAELYRFVSDNGKKM